MDLKPAIQVEAELGLVQFLRRTILLGIKHLLVVVQCGLWLPEAEFGRSDEGGIDTILVVEVVGHKDGDLVGFVVDLADMRKEIILTRKTCHEVHPRIGEVEVDALANRRTQQRVTAFVEHTTVVHDHGSQHVVWRTGDTLTVTQSAKPYTHSFFDS